MRRIRPEHLSRVEVISSKRGGEVPGNDYDICGIVSTHRTIGVFSYQISYLQSVHDKSLFELQSTIAYVSQRQVHFAEICEHTESEEKTRSRISRIQTQHYGPGQAQSRYLHDVRVNLQR